MRVDLRNRIALVTGAAQGIGRAIAERLAASGAEVHICDVDSLGLKRTAAELGLAATTLDLSNRDAVGNWIAAVLTDYGRIDFSINAAGGVCGQAGGPIEGVDESAWQEIFSANLTSAFWLAQAVAPSMKEAGFGRLVHIASGAGLRPSLTGIQAYTAAKHGLVGLTKQLSQELGPYGITVNAVAPGFVRSNPATERQWQSYGPEGQQQLLNSIHRGRLGTAEDIAAAVLFFVSDAADWISGQILSVDGGRS